jgi:hypothetical protein
VTRRLAVEVAGTAIICALIAAAGHAAAWWRRPWICLGQLDRPAS